jgi:type IX secretion system PorP/SprF family membrane protein
MNRSLLYISLILFLPLKGLTQQLPLYTQSNFNNFGINPAFAGTGECADIRLGYRQQWVGFEGNPVTAFVNGNGKINRKRGSRKSSFFGIGGRVFNDRAGPYNFIQMELAGSYHVKLGENLYASVGLFAGIIQSRFDASGLTLTNYNDPAINGSQANILFPSITPGILMYNQKFYLGFSIQNLVNLKMPDVGYDTRTARHYWGKFAYSFELTDRSDLVPSIIMRYAYNSTLAYDVNLIYKLDNKYQFGVAYRNETAIAALVNIKIFNMFSIGYAFDFIINNLNLGTYGSHEIMVGFNTCDLGEGDSKVRCAAFN